VLHRADGEVYVAVAGDHHDDGGGIQAVDLLEPVQPLAAARGVAGEVHVEDHAVVGPLAQERREGVRPGRGVDRRGDPPEQQADGRQHVLVVVDDEDGGAVGGGSGHGFEEASRATEGPPLPPRFSPRYAQWEKRCPPSPVRGTVRR